MIASRGKQYRVEPGALVTLERLSGEVGSRLDLDQVLMVSDGTQGENRPADGLRGEGGLGDRGPHPRGQDDVFKFKKRKKYRRKNGHRQELTRVRIAEIVA